MSDDTQLREGQVLTGPSFSEPMLVETVRENGSGVWVVGMVGQRSERFRRVTLTGDDIAALKIADSMLSYSGDGQRLRLALQAYALGIAYEFDPYFGLSISRVDPLPHQLEAVYDHLLKLPSVRFLLADDAGAGKTIMAGLLIRELKLRGLVERILVVCPANLSFQWQRELREKFDERFLVLKGGDIRDQFGVNQWMERKRVITSLDLAKREEILPGLRQAHWDLVVVDEAHRMSARDESHKSQRYRLGELLRDTSDHMLFLTATPHKGDPHNFTLFLQLLDPDAYGDVKSIREAMDQQRAPFYLRRTKEAMVYFPKREADGTWTAQPVFTKRIAQTAEFAIDGAEFELYREITRFVKRQSQRAADESDNPRARAVGFLMSLYQRRLASSTHAMRRSLENRARRLEEGLKQARELVRTIPPDLPDWDELDEFEDAERERLERMLEAVTLAGNAEHVREEVAELRQFAEQAKAVERSGTEAKLKRLRRIMEAEGFFDRPDQRLLLFTEFKDTLDYLMERLAEWGFRVGCIHGGMKPGSRDEPGTRLHAEQQFREGGIQVLVATEAAGEGINLQCCHILFNYDIPWNPNRLEQRMGRIHRYGQQRDCLIFNFVATNTIEGRVLQRLLDKLQEIRDALDDDAVFNVVGEVLPSARVERVLRDYYAGRLGESDLEERILRDVDEGHFRAICQTALEGLAAKKLNLDLLVERHARAKERRVVPETISRFMGEAAKDAALALKPVRRLPHTFQPGRTPIGLKRYERDEDWGLAELAVRYPRLSTDRKTAEANNLEWVTPGHPLFEALRRHGYDLGQDAFTKGACFHSLAHDEPARVDFYRARAVDGLGQVIHERLFAVELRAGGTPRLRGRGVLADMTPAPAPNGLPAVARLPEETAWLNENALVPFVEEVRSDRQAEVGQVAEHVELSLTEILQRLDEDIGRAADEVAGGAGGAEGRLALAERRHAEVLTRRERRREELERQRAVTLQGVERLASALVLPHPEGHVLDHRRLRPHPETEMTAMRVVMEYEAAQGRKVEDVHKENLGYDVTSRDLHTGESRLIEVKGLAAPSGSILLTPNERRVAEDRRDCYWLYVVTNCASSPELQEPIPDPARFPWHEVSKVQHYWMDVKAMTGPMSAAGRDDPGGGSTA
ncbi:MAG: helicase-related protein [Gemmatimonadota bacterium]|nr:helicase-related protein [Gemmatimonadota bacterium]